MPRPGSALPPLPLPEMIVRFSDGRHFRIPRADPMYAQIVAFGAYEPIETAAVTSLLRAGDFAIDVGANHGWFSLLIASIVGPDGKTWAIEPVQAMVDALRRNLASNPSLSVEVHPLALGVAEGTLEMHVFDDLPHGHASAATLGHDDFSTHRCAVRPLDQLLAGDRPVTLVKVDVEGSELAVLEGASETIASPTPPMWLLEVNRVTAQAFGYEPAALLTMFPSRRWEVYRLTGRAAVREHRPLDAPDGTTWLVVPTEHRKRVASL